MRPSLLHDGLFCDWCDKSENIAYANLVFWNINMKAVVCPPFQ